MPVFRILLCFALLPIALLTPVGSARADPGSTYHVSPDGDDDNSGSRDQPWRTIEHSVPQLQPGDTLLVRGGTYNERVEPPRRLTSASKTSPIHVIAQPGERPVIRGRLYLSDADHWIFEGLSVTADDGAYSAGDNLLKIMDGSGWIFRGGEIWGARDTSAAVFIGSNQAGEPSDWSFIGNCVHDTEPRDPVNRPNEDHNVYVYSGASNGPGLIERNVLYGAPNGENIKLGPDQGSVTVRHNTMYRAAMNMLLTEKAHHNVIERNLMGRGSPAPGKDWYPNIRGFKLTGEGNVARNNAGFEADQFVFVGNDGGGSTTTIAQSGNLFPVSPQLDDTSRCDGFYPTKGSYRGYGAYAPVGSGDLIKRIFGAGREATSVEISKSSFASGDSKTVVVARSDNYPDALAGGPFARALNAPILLTPGDRLNSTVANEVKRLGADDAVLLGGKAALSEQVRRDLEGMGVAVKRVAGENRFETAAAVAAELAELSGTDVKNAYVVEGADSDPNRGWPDAVAVGSLAAQQARPILLVTTESLPGDTKTALNDLGVEQATIIGGEASVSNDVAKAIASVGPSVNRIAGESRFGTSRKVAETAQKAGADASRVWFATGGSFPDALAAGPAVAKDGGVLLLVPGDSTFLNAEAVDWLDRFQDGVTSLKLIGGKAAISTAIEDKARHQLLFR